MALFESLINDAGKGGKRAAGFSVTMVHYTKLIPSENNNYSMESIKELAQMIVLAGKVEQNLLARKKTPDQYELIAGHRRRQAVKYLVEECGREEYAMMPVHVEQDGDTMSEIKLILTNCAARIRSDWERMMEVTRLTDLLKAMQTGSQEEQDRFREWIGMEPGISGRELRKVVAELLGMSETKVAQLNHINNNLAPEMMNKFQSGNIGVSVANEAAGLPAEKQQELAGREEVKLADVKAVSESDTEKETESVSESDTEEIQIPGQQSIETDYPEMCPQEKTDTMDPETRRIYLNSLARKLIENNKEWFLQDFNNRVLNVVESENQFKQKFRNAYSIMHFLDPVNEKVAWVDMFDTHIQIWSGAGKCLGDARWFYLCAAVQSMWNVIAMEDAQRSTGNQDAASEQQDATEDATEKQQGNDDQEEPEAAGVTDILKLEYDRELLEGMIRTQEEQLEQLGPGWKEDMPTVYIRHCMMLQAYKLLLLTRNEEEPTTKPELPIMKNNDMRKEWLWNYKTWGVWYKDEHIGSTFYKYDFECGARLVVEEFTNKHDHGAFTSANYHLIGGPEPPKGSYGIGKWTRHEEYNHYPNNETELVEFLKYIQKGA